jgi:hypothetical protein
VEHEFYCSIQLVISSSQLTSIFFRGVETTNQVGYNLELTIIQDIYIYKYIYIYIRVFLGFLEGCG